MEAFEIMIGVICFIGAVVLIPTGVQIKDNTRYWLGGVAIIIYGCICGVVTIAWVSQVIFIMTN